MIIQTNTDTFKVKSMITPDKYSTVSRICNSLVHECQTMHMYFTEISVRDIADHYEIMEIKIS